MRVLIVDDSGIFRRGLRLLLEAAGVEVVADLADVATVLAGLPELRPDVCVLDVRMPPTFTDQQPALGRAVAGQPSHARRQPGHVVGDEGVAAAEQIRCRQPDVGVLLLSTYADTAWAERLLCSGHGGVGYLLKDRVDHAAELVEALRRVAGGGTVLDPDVVASLVRRKRVAGRLDALTDRERRVLELMARGMSNVGIGRDLFVSGKTVETYAAAVFQKLGLSGDNSDRERNRRVLAVLTYLQHAA